MQNNVTSQTEDDAIRLASRRATWQPVLHVLRAFTFLHLSRTSPLLSLLLLMHFGPTWVSSCFFELVILFLKDNVIDDPLHYGRESLPTDYILFLCAGVEWLSVWLFNATLHLEFQFFASHWLNGSVAVVEEGKTRANSTRFRNLVPGSS